MVNFRLISILLLIVLSLSLVYAQYADYTELPEDSSSSVSSTTETRVPRFVIIIVLIVVALVLYFHILHKKFISYLSDGAEPQSAAASSLLAWLFWVGLLTLLLYGIDLINMDYYNIGDYLLSSLIRIGVVVLVFFLFSLLISPYKNRQS